MGDDEADFLRCYIDFEKYPTNLIHNYDRPQAVEKCSLYHQYHAKKLFRKNNPTIYVRIRDYNNNHQCGQGKYGFIFGYVSETCP